MGVLESKVMSAMRATYRIIQTILNKAEQIIQFIKTLISAVAIGMLWQAAIAQTAGSIPGTFSVNTSGAATYTIPIALPPGTAGMVPNLSLTYDSASGNGLMGVGWSLSGLSAITRCDRTIAQDGARAGVDLTFNDRFCLDGKRLIVVAGNYGAVGSEYRTEIESFSRVIANGSDGSGPASFTVISNTGVAMEFGATGDSHIYAVGLGKALVWALNKVTDTKGNYYSIYYINNTATGQFYPSRIDYTGNITVGLQTYNSVQFFYDFSRPDIETGYIAGSKYRNTARLTNVKTYAGTVLVNDYKMAYNTSTSTSKSRISSITQCDTANTCLPATVLNWSNDINQFAQVTDSQSPEYAALKVRTEWVDANGDGLADLCRVIPIGPKIFNENYAQEQVVCYLRTATGFNPQPISSPILNNYSDSSYQPTFVDVNGDGLTDFCVGFTCYLGSGVDFSSTVVVTPAPTGVGNLTWKDIDGDGRADVCWSGYTAATGNQYACQLSTGTGFSSPIILAIPIIPADTTSTPATNTWWADINGDKVLSYCRLANGVLYCNKWTSSGLSPTTVTSAVLNGGSKSGRGWADINGDGLADFCRIVVVSRSGVFGDPIIQGQATCTLSTGAGFGDTISGPTMTMTDVGGIGLGADHHTWIDLDGDGRTDFCTEMVTPAGGSSRQYQCIRSSYGGFGAVLQTPAVDPLIYESNLADVTGDAKIDFCIEERTGAGVAQTAHYRCYPTLGSRPDIMTSITNGFGATHAIDYRPLTDSSRFYTKTSGATYPTIDIQDATHVVRSVTSSDGIGGSTTTFYNYYGARVDLQGRGFLGFTFLYTSLPSGQLTQQVFNQSYPSIGTSAGDYLYSEASTLLRYSGTALNANSLGGTRYFVYPTTTTIQVWDLNGAFMSWNESTLSNYDAYGNAQNSSSITKDVNGTVDGYSTSTTTLYQNDTTNWILGLPTSATVTKNRPNTSGAATATNPLSATRNTVMSYFADGLLKQEIAEPNNGGLAGATNLRLQTDYTYDGFGNLLTKTLSGANITTRTEVTNVWDAKGQFATTVKNALLHPETRTYDARFGKLATLKGPNNLTTSWTYDGFGRTATETRADGTRSTVTYTDQPNYGGVPYLRYTATTTNTLVSSGANISPPVTTLYDILNRPYESYRLSFDGVNNVFQDWRYDNLGRLATQYAPYKAGDVLRPVTTAYDDLNRPTTSTTPDGGVTTYTYNGLTTSVSNAKSQVTSKTRNSQGQISGVVNAQGTADQSGMAYEYDVWSNLTKTTDALNNSTTIAYDLRGRKTNLLDPDMGSWSYTYDNLGQLLVQKDAKLQTTSFAYDLLGRTTQQSAVSLISNWYYEKNKAGTACVMGIGKLCEATGDNAYSRKPSYDSLGRLSSTSELIDSTTAPYVSDWTYDTTGRLSTITYPNSGSTAAPKRVKVQYGYTALGYLNTVTDITGTAKQQWQLTAQNADGNTLTETFGNGLLGTYGYATYTGRTASAAVGSAASPYSLNLQTYGYDLLGNVSARPHPLPYGEGGSFTYDNLNRLVTASTIKAGGQTADEITTVSYNAIGNITSKKTTVNGVALIVAQSAINAASYNYPASGTGAVRPHALTSITGTVNGLINPSYGYDANGNIVSAGNKTIVWNGFNLPSTISKTANTTAPNNSPGLGTAVFLYSPEHQRIKQSWYVTTAAGGAVPTGSPAVTTVYVHSPHYEKETYGSGTTATLEHKHYITASGGGSGSRVIAMVTNRTTSTGAATATNASDTVYFHPDSQGSTALTTNSVGTVQERLSYDAWGDRRVATTTGTAPNQTLAGSQDSLNAIQPGTTLNVPSTDRGYTGHEHLDRGNLGLINMNARIYDPTLGRFLSPDPTIQAPYYTQSHNRYAYTFNNPLKYSDPSGYLTTSSSRFITGLMSGGMIYGFDNNFAGFPNTASFNEWLEGYAMGLAMRSGWDTAQSKDYSPVATLANGPSPSAPTASDDRGTGFYMNGGQLMGRPEPMLIGRNDAELSPAASVGRGIERWANSAMNNDAWTLCIACYSGLDTLRTAGRGLQGKNTGLENGLLIAGAILPMAKGLGPLAKTAINWKSVKQFGHTFSQHGEGLKNTERLLDRARGTGTPQGQWLSNDKAAEVLSVIRVDGPATIRIPDGIGQVIKSDGSIVKAEWARVVPGDDGLRTAFPIVP